MNLDLSSLYRAIESLDAALRVVNDEAWLSAQSSSVQQTLLSRVVQNFEFVYECAQDELPTPRNGRRVFVGG